MKPATWVSLLVVPAVMAVLACKEKSAPEEAFLFEENSVEQCDSCAAGCAACSRLVDGCSVREGANDQECITCMDECLPDPEPVAPLELELGNTPAQTCGFCQEFSCPKECSGLMEVACDAFGAYELVADPSVSPEARRVCTGCIDRCIEDHRPEPLEPGDQPAAEP
jgi:hypothetical protein